MSSKNALAWNIIFMHQLRVWNNERITETLKTIFFVFTREIIKTYRSAVCENVARPRSSKTYFKTLG
jgi:hypothetical protein